MIQAAEEVVEHAKKNNLSRQEVIDAENELAKAVQAKNSPYGVQKAGLNAEACIASPTTRMVEPTFNRTMNEWHFEVAQNELSTRRDQHRDAG